MRDPRWIGTTFNAFLHVVKAARYTRHAALLSLPVAGLSAMVLWQPVSEPSSFTMMSEAGTTMSQPADAEAPAAVAAVVSAPAAPVAVAMIDPSPAEAPTEQARKAVAPVRVPSASGQRMELEQHNLASFIASRYKVAFDNTQLFVDGAYKAARDYKLDPWLILAVMAVESSFDPSAVSSAGAHGLMQVLTRVHTEKFAPFGGVAAAFDPIANIRVGARILRDYIARDGTIEGGLKAYVGAALMSHDNGYGRKVLAERERLASIAQGKRLPVPPAPKSREPAPLLASNDKQAMARARVPASSEPASGVASGSLPAGPAPEAVTAAASTTTAAASAAAAGSAAAMASATATPARPAAAGLDIPPGFAP